MDISAIFTVAENAFNPILSHPCKGVRDRGGSRQRDGSRSAVQAAKACMQGWKQAHNLFSLKACAAAGQGP